MRQPLENVKIFADRRAQVAEQMLGSALIVASPPEYIRNGTVHYPFRQDSNLYYLTGFEEPETIFLFRPGMNPETVLFVRTKDLERETWDGFRYGPEAAQSQFRMDKTYPISEFEKMAPQLLKGVDKLYYRNYKNPEMDRKIEEVLLSLRVSQGRTGYGILTVLDADEFLGEFRVKKTDADIENMKKGGELTSEAHQELMKYIRPGMTEREVHGFFIYQVMKRGAAREGYGGIFAGGANATTLHYVFNDQPLKSGDLFLVDAAGEINYFTADITRTYPVNGRFNEEQAEVYQGVLDVQKAIIDAVKPGVPFQNLQDMATDLLTELMLELGLLTGRKEDIIKTGEHKKYYPHGVGHFLGMDVHDSGMYFSKKGEPRLIEENMVFTVEPGLYIPANDQSAASEYRGIGVRIEDNIRVTTRGHENFTIKAPKEIADLEKIIGSYGAG
ncbi:MAG: Xaa-Pro aminopeptidase [Bdellovibrio sp. CG10_big_fil_rev_8_21_14_0_10_47_8]|nr:MAG: Xaa-Pro aminopeptidase [Bdellovibrio sp. CG10_big_fil_rev_8_21_14_0_10_47_8]